MISPRGYEGNNMRKMIMLLSSFGACLAAAEVRADSWTTVAPMPEPKWELGAATAGDGLIYAIGGGSGFTPEVATVFAYDNQSDQWTQSASMSEVRRHFATAVGADGRI